MKKKSKIYFAGHTGLIGSAILRLYKKEGFTNLIYKSRSGLDLMNQRQVDLFFKKEKPEYVIMAAGRVGGIKANMIYPAEFIYENMTIQNNVVWSAYKYGVKKLLYLSCGCAYPTSSPQPIKESYLLTNLPESTNEGFALAKISGIKLCEKINIEYRRNFISCLPANTYGPNDHYDELRSHVITALIKKFHRAKIKELPYVKIWGSGTARREFIYVDDLASAILLLMQKYNQPQFINIGSGAEVSIKTLAFLIKKIVGYKGKITFDTTKPDGMRRRFLESSRIASLGFKPKVHLEEGLKMTYSDYLKRFFL